MLDDMIKVANEKMSSMIDDDDDEVMKDSISRANATEKSFPDTKTSQPDSPLTPTSVLPPTRTSYSPPRLLPLRVQAVGKLNPIDLKRLAFHFPQEASQNFHPLNDMYKTIEGAKVETEAKKDYEKAGDAIEVDIDNKLKLLVGRSVIQQMSNSESSPRSSFGILQISSPECSGKSSSGIQPMPNPKNSTKSSSCNQPMSSQESSARATSMGVQLLAQTLPKSPSNAATKAGTAPPSALSSLSIPVPPTPPPAPSSVSKEQSNSATGSTAVMPPPPPPLPSPMGFKNILPPPPPTGSSATPPPPPPPPVSIKTPPPPPPSMLKGNIAVPPPPLPPLSSIGSAPAPPPLMSSTSGGAPPPPPGGARLLRPKKANTKLKRSSQIGNLYRVLKGKVEGSTLDGKSTQGRKGKSGASSGGNQGMGMADALAEMTKRYVLRKYPTNWSDSCHNDNS